MIFRPRILGGLPAPKRVHAQAARLSPRATPRATFTLASTQQADDEEHPGRQDGDAVVAGGEQVTRP